ncbi:hypothetical protein KP509_01G090400 [Ceratopteris richardii]|uniref:GATA-type domain-containing protein n=1 Tax=Ceratopteris richardii TaxID=49495 RepID=A0A8T2VLT2_CERRI|nr:hypothetical protein KP509_01G090400 [Ceratopteris richardii]
MGKGSTNISTTSLTSLRVDHHHEAMRAMEGSPKAECKAMGSSNSETKGFESISCECEGKQSCRCEGRESNSISVHYSNSGCNEDLLMDDLSEFSNEDIAAPILISDSLSPPEQHCDDNISANSTFKSGSTAYTSSSRTVLLQNSPALENSSVRHCDQITDAALSLPCQDATCFEWLSSLGDDNLIYTAPHFGMDSFLLVESSEPFSDFNSGEITQNSLGDMKDVTVEHIDTSIAANSVKYDHDVSEDTMWSNGMEMSPHAAICVPSSLPGSRSARSKRARSSAGWLSTSSILSDNCSEGHSSSQMKISSPQYGSGNSSICGQEASKYGGATEHTNLENNIDSRLLSTPNRDSSLYGVPDNRIKFGSREICSNQLMDDGPREENMGSFGGGGCGLQPRRCSHCQSQKTPQWRAGPSGPKTLCNACGVRYKSGRLFDEYRPAKSPTFLSYKHSNSHKKVMEMRRRKTIQQQLQHQHSIHHAVVPLRKHAEITNQQFLSKMKTKPLDHAYSDPFSAYNFSDVTLISTRNAIDSASSFL